MLILLPTLFKQFSSVEFKVHPDAAYSTNITSYSDASKAGESAVFEVQVFDRYGNLRPASDDVNRINVAINGA